MKRLFAPALSVALILFLAPMSGALAQQNVHITMPMSPVGYSVCGNATNTTTGNCSGLNSANGTPTIPGNTVTVDSGVSIAGSSVYGRWEQSNVAATSAINNRVASGGDTDAIYGGSVWSMADGFDATATWNKVDSSGTVTQIIGGYAMANNNSDADASDNQVSISGGTVPAFWGGFAQCYNGCTANASDNMVTISGGTVGSAGVNYGGQAELIDNDATASRNKIVITGGTLAGSVFGGDAYSLNGGMTASDNVVEISGTASLGSGIGLHGGRVGAGGSSTGNTLNLKRSGVNIGTLADFQVLNFTLPASLGNGDAMLTAATSADITGANISIEVAPHSSLQAGDEVVLIDVTANGGLTDAPAAGTSIPSSTAGYTFETVAATDQLRVKVLAAPKALTTAVPTLDPKALLMLALLLAVAAVAGVARRLR